MVVIIVAGRKGKYVHAVLSPKFLLTKLKLTKFYANFILQTTLRADNKSSGQFSVAFSSTYHALFLECLIVRSVQLTARRVPDIDLAARLSVLLTQPHNTEC